MLKHYFVLCCLTPLLWAQEQSKLEIFGFGQTRILYEDNRGFFGQPISSYFSAQSQTLDLFLTKQYPYKINFLANIEATGDFEFGRQNIKGELMSRGSWALSELWLNWTLNPMLKIKFGRFIAPFNEFNEIKAKQPLHPYLFRPVVYESSLDLAAFDPSAWAPRNGFLSVYGALGSKSKFEYNFWAGNSDHVVNSVQSLDSTVEKVIGLRLGWHLVAQGDLRTGISLTHDQETWKDVNAILAFQGLSLPTEIDRNRLGLNFSYEHNSGTYFKGELIQVSYQPTSAQKDSADQVVKELGRSFYYGSLGWKDDFWDMYTMMSLCQDQQMKPFWGKYIRSLNVGGAYNPIPSIALKIQYQNWMSLNQLNSFWTPTQTPSGRGWSQIYHMGASFMF